MIFPFEPRGQKVVIPVVALGDCVTFLLEIFGVEAVLSTDPLRDWLILPLETAGDNTAFSVDAQGD